MKTSIVPLLFAGLVALPLAVSRPAAAADDSYTGAVVNGAKGAAESTKDAATSAGTAVKDSAKSAAGYASDTAKNAASRVAGKDSHFVRIAAIGGMTEVKSAELAKTKASSAAVKSFAEHMVEDHTKANKELEQIAKEKGITVPPDLDNEHKAKLDELAALSGAAFDKAYVKMQRDGHAQMLKLMKDEAQNGKDPDLKSFAQKTKSVVAEHQAKIEKLDTKSHAGS